MSWFRRRTGANPERVVVDEAALERERIYADLHDDVGARLLELIHGAESEETRELARLALEDLRDIVSRTRSIRGSLVEVLAMIREETQRRLDARGVAMQWEIPDDLPDVALADSQALHLFRIFRESITNALRHGHAHRLRIRGRIVAGEFVADITDDGPGTPPSAVGQGRGTTNIRTRAEALGGQADWAPGTEGGTKVLLRLPLGRDQT